jgi:hypothetical protein
MSMRLLPLLGCVIVLVFTATLWPATAAAATCRPGSGPNLVGQNVRGKELEQAALACADLRGVDLHGLDLLQANLAGADLTGANLSGADLSQADLTGAVLVRADVENTEFSQATLTGANLTDADAHDADFEQATLTDTDLDGANLAGVSFDEVDDSGATARNASGLLPADGLGGIAASLIAWFALRPWWRGSAGRGDLVGRRVTPGRILAGVAACLAVVGFVVAVFGARSMVVSPTVGAWASILPLAFLFLFSRLCVLSAVRRVQSPFVAVALTVVGTAGAYLVCTAGVAGATDAINATAFANAPGGLSRGWLGFGIGVAVLVVLSVLARLSRGRNTSPAAWS